MSGYKLVVLTDPAPGREDAYNDWYSNRHLGDILRIPGFCAAQRFRKKMDMAGEIKQQYLAIYEMNVAGPEAAGEAAAALSTTEMEMSDALDLASVGCGLFEPCGERLTPGATAGSYLQLAFTDAVKGREADFDAWYNEVHLREYMSSGGYAAAERYKLLRTVGGQFDNPLVTVYRMEAQDWPAAQATLQGAKGMKLTMTDAGRFDRTQLALYEACSPRVMS